MALSHYLVSQCHSIVTTFTVVRNTLYSYCVKCKIYILPCNGARRHAVGPHTTNIWPGLMSHRFNPVSRHLFANVTFFDVCNLVSIAKHEIHFSPKSSMACSNVFMELNTVGNRVVNTANLLLKTPLRLGLLGVILKIELYSFINTVLHMILMIMITKPRDGK